eukprot:607940-Hanusia_phi.AAC.1
MSDPGSRHRGRCEERGVSCSAGCSVIAVLRPWLPRLFFALCVCVRARSTSCVLCLRLSGFRPSFVVWY